MVAVADPAEKWSVARFTEAADACIQDIHRRGKLPILVGGTGLYLDAIISGLTLAPGEAGGAVRKELEAQLAQEGITPLWEELQQVDPESAARLHIADEKRILRALEVYRETGCTISEHNRRTAALPRRYDPIYIGLAFRDRSDMRDLIDRRVDAMMDAGLLGEVQALLEQGVPRTSVTLAAAFSRRSSYRSQTAGMSTSSMGSSRNSSRPPPRAPRPIKPRLIRSFISDRILSRKFLGSSIRRIPHAAGKDHCIM